MWCKGNSTELMSQFYDLHVVRILSRWMSSFQVFVLKSDAVNRGCSAMAPCSHKSPRPENPDYYLGRIGTVTDPQASTNKLIKVIPCKNTLR